MSLHKAVEILKDNSKIGRHTRRDIEDALENTAEQEIDRDLDEIRDIVEDIQERQDEQLDRIERIEAEVGLRGNSQDGESSGE